MRYRVAGGYRIPIEPDRQFVGPQGPSKWPSKECEICAVIIRWGDQVVKLRAVHVDQGRKTTQTGQGSGVWVCAVHDTRPQQAELF